MKEPKENNETPNSNENNLISLENYDFSNKSKLINSPRSLNACLRLGIEISELYKISMDDFKQKYPDVRYLDKELLELRYNGENDFRKKTAEQAKEEKPNKEELNIIKNKIEYYKDKIKNIKEKKLNQFKNELNNNKIKENKRAKQIIKVNKIKKIKIIIKMKIRMNKRIMKKIKIVK